MKAIVLLLILGGCLLPVSVYATPDPAAWRREVLLGSNDDSYFVWVLYWDQAGYSHTFRAGMSLERRSLLDRALLETHELLATQASTIDTPHEWKRASAELPSFDIAGYLREQDALPAFSIDYGYEVVLQSGALVLTEGGRAAPLLSASELSAQLPVPVEDAGEMRIVPIAQTTGIHRGVAEDVWFYTLQLNSASWDDDWSELLIVVPGSRVTGAR